MRRVIVILAFVAAALGALATRVVVEGRRALRDGDAWMLRGRPADAIRAYETAARWYLPLAPHVEDAYRKLHALAEPSYDARPALDSQQQAQQAAVQLAAWRAIRGAALATRSLWTPHADDLVAANAAIARISAAIPHAGTTEIAWHRERLDRPTRPATGAVALASLGILLWVGGAFALVRRGVSLAGGLQRRAAGISGIVIVVGLGCWAAGLYNA